MGITDFLSSIRAGHIIEDCGILTLILFTLLQISPIKINPWSWIGKLCGKLLKKLGRAINGEVIAELGEVKTKLSALEQRDKAQDAERAEDKALDARRRILQFADEIRRKDRHSEEHFNNVFEDIHFYQNYCKTHENFENDRAKISIKIIESTYEKCSSDNDFL